MPKGSDRHRCTCFWATAGGLGSTRTAGGTPSSLLGSPTVGQKAPAGADLPRERPGQARQHRPSPGREDDGPVISSVLELLVLSVPSLLYARRLRLRGHSAAQARAAVGWRTGDPQPYGLAVAVAIVLLPLTYVALRVIPSGSVAHSAHLHVNYGQASTFGDYLAILLLAVAEEILFRGFIAGLLFRRYGFATGNVIQAFIFLAPHLLLLLVSTAIWPLLPVQLIAGWLLGLLRSKSDSIGPSSLAHVAANLIAPLLLTI
jgi:membrane protease YdiL (CAAX protease family)